MGSLFPQRISCFSCGYAWYSRGARVSKAICQRCNAVNFYDENGAITDPPQSVTAMPHGGRIGGSSSPTSSSNDFQPTDMFCSQCVRNQHMFMTMLSSYLPSPDDPKYREYERNLPEFRRNLEERYPQVCARCEPRVKERIRQTGYEAKSDHMRRMMDRSKAGRAAASRNHAPNWKSLLVFIGGFMYWASLAGQLGWNIMGVLDDGEWSQHTGRPLSVLTLSSCVFHTLYTRRAASHCHTEFASFDGLCLVVGMLSLWWNPKLRDKVEGRSGRLAGLGDYYRLQFLVMVTRCVFWAVFKSRSTSGLKPTQLPALHLFMILFILFTAHISRRVVKYDTRPLFSWSDVSPPSTTPDRQSVSRSPCEQNHTLLESGKRTSSGFPLEKLGTPRREPEKEPATLTPQPDADDMDWTPSVQHDIRPVNANHRPQKSIMSGPSPFYGSLPAAPQPPSWKLHNKSSQKPVEQVVERNPFRRSPTQSWQRESDSSAPTFAQPKFFSPNDHVASTGLESLFDQAFSIQSPEDEGEKKWQRERANNLPQPTDAEMPILFQYLRLTLLLACLAAWLLLQHGYISVPGNYVEVASLGLASIITGLGLLNVLKRPLSQWNGSEITLYVGELMAAILLGYNIPQVSFERGFFDKYGKILLMALTIQEGMSLAFSGQPAETAPAGATSKQGEREARTDTSFDGFTGTKSRSPSESHSSAPSLSFASTAPESSFSSQPREPHYQLGFQQLGFQPNQGYNKNHSFTLNGLKSAESEGYDSTGHESDTETTMTTATNATGNTVRNIRYGRNAPGRDTLYSPNRTDLGPGFGGLSLEDKPVRMTRSRTQQQLDAARGYPTRRAR